MTIKQLVKKLVRYKIEFSCEWDEEGYDYYLICVLGNVEHIIHHKDYDGLAQLWEEIVNYWI